MEEEEQAIGEEGLTEDLAFPCEASSLLSDYYIPIARFQDDITWLRSREICQSPTHSSLTTPTTAVLNKASWETAGSSD
ncbi:calpain-10-like [Coregonus clupeaformis]|uniref:calpain-10-like n=1 Tax=Coregonus clupeaformis TaxID=59861 RepID=UPI001BE0B4A6|nr:calpain-10-like [Coregonus clupeaformis]